jgi:hypothetical protein
MTAKIIIVGTSHELQCGLVDQSLKYSEVHLEKYKKLILNLCKSECINLLAEEMSLDGLFFHKVFKTVVAELVEKELGTLHQYIDITCDGRKLLNIDKESCDKYVKIEFPNSLNDEDRKTQFRNILINPMRELYWFGKLLRLNEWPVLFICGEDHVDSMSKLIREADKDVLAKVYHLDQYLG